MTDCSELDPPATPSKGSGLFLPWKLGASQKAWHWYFLAICLCLYNAYRFYLVSLAWANRTVPPDPDDAYAYLSLVRRLADFGLSANIPALSNDWYVSNFWYTPWLALLALPHKLFGINLETLYQFNFYLGFFLLSIAAAYAMIRIAGPLYAGIGLVVYTFSWGIGCSFHLVVPAHYLLAMLFISWSLLNSQRKSAAYLFSLCILISILLHPMAMVVLILFGGYFILYAICKRKIPRHMARSLIIMTAMLCACGLLLLIGGAYSQIDMFFASPSELVGVVDGLTQRLFGWLGESKPYLTGSAEGKSWITALFQFDKGEWDYLCDLYFTPLFSRDSLMIIPFILGLIALIRSNKIELPLFWLVNIIIMLLMLKTNRSNRMLLFVWPLTYMIVAYGFYWAVNWAITTWKDTGHQPLKGTNTFALLKQNWLLLAVLSLTLLTGAKFIKHNNSLNQFWASKISKTHNFVWDKTCPSGLLEITDDNSLIIFQGKTAIYSFLAHGIWARKIKSLQYLNGKDIRRSENNIFYVAKTKSPSLDRLLGKIKRCAPRLQSIDIKVHKNCGSLQIFKVSLKNG